MPRPIAPIDPFAATRRAFVAALPTHFQRLGWSADQVRAHQTTALRDLLRIAVERSPFHAERLAAAVGDVDTFEMADLGGLPVMTKLEMMTYYDEVTTDRRLTRDAVETFLADVGDEPKLLFDEYLVLASGGAQGSGECSPGTTTSSPTTWQPSCVPVSPGPAAARSPTGSAPPSWPPARRSMRPAAPPTSPTVRSSSSPTRPPRCHSTRSSAACKLLNLPSSLGTPPPSRPSPTSSSPAGSRSGLRWSWRPASSSPTPLAKRSLRRSTPYRPMPSARPKGSTVRPCPATTYSRSPATSPTSNSSTNTTSMYRSAHPATTSSSRTW